MTNQTFNTKEINGLDIFYREAGDRKNPTILLLHGFPTSSHMYRNLIPQLAENYHVIAPDYPGFGHSAMPSRDDFDYTFDNFADLVDGLLTELSIDKFAIYVFDYGAPVGFRLFHKNPERITAIISQNGNAYVEGIEGFWDPIKAYWETGAETEREAFREYQPPFLAVWGKNDEIFTAPGATAFSRDFPDADIHLLDTGHFALETHGEEIGDLIKTFLAKNFKSSLKAAA